MVLYEVFELDREKYIGCCVCAGTTADRLKVNPLLELAVVPFMLVRLNVGFP
jgi:hypothetical protein